MLNDGYYYGDMGAGGYEATHRGGQPRYKQFHRVTPNFEHKEGLRHGPFLPAPYLPGIRLDEVFHDWYVIAAGSPVVLLDDGFIVPAGMKKLIAAGATGVGPQYSQADVVSGVRNASGAAVAAGEYVIDSILAEGLGAGRVIGVASYDVFRQLNSDPHNPGSYEQHNYNRQNGVAVLTSYVLEFPIEPLKRTEVEMKVTAADGQTTLDLGHENVLEHHIAVTVNKDRLVDFTLNAGAGADGVDQLAHPALSAGDEVVVKYIYEEDFYQAPFAGLQTVRGDVKVSDLITFDENSKFVKFSASTIDEADAATIKAAIEEREDILGHVTAVDYKFPKQMLDKVKSAYDERLYSPIINPETGEKEFSGLDKTQGSATDGVPHMIQYAGGDLKTGIVRFHLHL